MCKSAEISIIYFFIIKCKFRLKQNIDELDNLLYDLNHARNVTPDTDTYGNNAGNDQFKV